MQAVGIICEYNPFHLGHVRQLRLASAQAKGPVVCVMSGSFVQRGEPAVLWKFARARMAVLSGADLVLELPLTWACAGARRFALGGVGLLKALGTVSHLSFGSESGDLEALEAAAALEGRADVEERIRALLSGGMSYATARQQAVTEADPRAGARLSDPNDILGVEYLRAVRELEAPLTPLPILRAGAVHDGAPAAGLASASHIRELLLAGKTEEAGSFLPPAAVSVLMEEMDAGRGPVNPRSLDTAAMVLLRRMEAGDFARLPEVSEGLEYRLARAAAAAVDPMDFCARVKTKRYPMARLRRILTAACLGLTREDFSVPLPLYARVLALNDTGRALLREVRDIPVIAKAADGRGLGDGIARQLELEARADDLFTLAFPAREVRRGGQGWTASPVYVPGQSAFL